jgi:inorganic triphosphatase YgiF
VNDDVERELKLVPGDPSLLDELATQTNFGELAVVARRHEVQRNSFFDTAAHSLGAKRVGFRRRTVAGQAMAIWSLKSNARVLRGVTTRSEIELQLDADIAPMLALGTLRQVARQRGAAALAEQIGDALTGGGSPVATPFLEIETDRTILDLESRAKKWSVELALDRVQLSGHEYQEVEIEAELKRGDEQALDEVRSAIEALGQVHESNGSKLSRAMAHLQACDCAAKS